jgi:hypothetical protein
MVAAFSLTVVAVDVLSLAMAAWIQCRRSMSHPLSLSLSWIGKIYLTLSLIDLESHALGVARLLAS